MTPITRCLPPSSPAVLSFYNFSWSPCMGMVLWKRRLAVWGRRLGLRRRLEWGQVQVGISITSVRECTVNRFRLSCGLCIKMQRRAGFMCRHPQLSCSAVYLTQQKSCDSVSAASQILAFLSWAQRGWGLLNILRSLFLVGHLLQ